MSTENLIARLASSAEPVRPLPSPAIRLCTWSAVALAAGAAGIAAVGVRADIDVAIRQPAFMTTAVVALATAALAAAASLVLAVPGAERSAALRGSTLLLALLWLTVLLVAAVRAGYGFAADLLHWPICFMRVVAIGLIPAAVLFVMLRRAAPLRLSWTAMLAAAAAMAVGAAAIKFSCPIDDSGHALLGHLGPVLAIGSLGAVMGRRLLK
jgi:hypothetical protein